MSSSFEPTGTATNLTRLEMEQLRKADAFANGKALTVGDSGLSPEGVVGVGSVNAEPYFTGPQVVVDDLLSALVPTKPGEGVGHTTFFPTTPTVGGGSTPTVLAGPTWYGPTQIGLGTTGFALSATEWSDAAGQFTLAGPGYNVQVGDYLVVNKRVTAATDLNDSCVATVTGVTSATVLDVGSIWNPTNVGSETALDPTAGDTFSYSIIRRGAVQLFAVPGSGPVGQEQTFLFVKPSSTLHSDLNPTLADINADRLTNVVSPQRAGVGADRSDSVYQSPAPRTGLDLLGYRVVFYPDDGAGNPDFSSPIASLNPTIDPAIPASDQRVTIDYSAGVVRFSCAPALGGDIKVSGGTDPTTGRLNLYATFFSYQSPAATGAAKSLYSTQSTTETTQAPARMVYDPALSTWVVHNPLTVRVGGIGVQAQLRVLDLPEATASLVGRANAMGVSVGDGTTSFGDFNGVNAIEQAVTAWGVAATTSLRVHVKRGAYTIEDLVVPAGQELILEGDGRQDTRVTLSPTGANAMTVTSGGQLVLQDLAFIQTTGGPIEVGGSLRVDRCLFEGVQTSYVMGNAFRSANSGYRTDTSIVRDSEFNHSGRTVSCIDFANSSGTRSGFKYLDCTFESPSTGEPLITVSVAVSAPGLFNEVVFDRCHILLHGIDSASSTALSGPTGLLNLDPSAGAHNDIGIDDWTFRDCTVSVADEVVDNKVLLHLLPIAWDAANVTVRMRVGKFAIQGGVWSVPGTQGSDFAPFFLMANYPVLEGVSFLGCGTAFGALGVAPEYQGNGAWTNPMRTALNDDTAMPSVLGANAAFSIAASGSGLITGLGGLTLRNVKFSRFHRSSGSGELFLQGPDLTQQAVLVDGITVDSFNFGAAETDVPFTRMTIRPGGVGTTNRGSQGVFRNIHFNLQPSSVAVDWVLQSIVNLSTEGDLDCERIFVDGWVSPTSNSFQVGRIGIDINNIWGSNPTVRGRMSLKNSRVWGMGTGIRVAGNPASYTLVGNEVITNGDGTADLSRGIDVYLDVHPSLSSRLESCSCTMSNLPAASTAVGVRLRTNRWEFFSPIFVTNNNVYLSTAETDITADNVAFAILSNHASSNMALTLLGNSGYYKAGAAEGFLEGKIQRRTGIALNGGPTPRGGGAGASIIGAETGYSEAFSSVYYYTSTEIMVNNNLILESP